MKYGFIECFHWDGANWSSYKFPVIGSNTLYNVLPTPEEGTRVLKEGKPEGYFDVKSFYKEVCDVLGFNPFTVTLRNSSNSISFTSSTYFLLHTHILMHISFP